MLNAIVELKKRILKHPKAEVVLRLAPGLLSDLVVLNDAPYYSIMVRDDNFCIHLPSFWRYVSDSRVVFGIDDDKQKFGLPKPFSVLEYYESNLRSKKLVEIRIGFPITDLTLVFEDHSYIEVLATSGGYETWSLYGSNISVICLGGGSLALY